MMRPAARSWHDVPVRNPVYLVGTCVQFGAPPEADDPILIGWSGAFRVTADDGREFTFGRDTRRRWRKRARR
ncbi:MAG: hypothetical protein J0H86_14300 [Xanthomonadaceae bacterium]|nr:hypothetical protein [Xanthomonadaceae bacterium]